MPVSASHSELGSVIPPFRLKNVDESWVSPENFKNQKALLVIFMCNHCPYVIAVQERINQIAKDYQSKGVTVIGISSNDPNYNSDDSFENMKIRSRELGYVFPYVFDESQEVARAFDAVCTPDPYLYVNEGGVFKLTYRGRIDDSWKDESIVKEKSLRLALDHALAGDRPLESQISSMGCSIKWRKQN